MNNVKLKLAVLAALGLASAQAAAALLAIPAAGFGTTAYTNAYNANRTVADPKQNFGSFNQATNTTTNNVGYVTATNEATSPVAGFTLVATTTITIPTTTGGTGNIGSVVDRVWRNAAATQCIFGTRVTLINADHNAALAGVQYFEVNDVARGGFAASGSVNAGYFLQAAAASPVYRIGRTFTSVQHRSATLSAGTNATGYLDLPGLGSTASINGVATYNTPLLVPTAAQQAADVNANWVDFTTDVNFKDDDGSSKASSGVYYVQAPCNATAPATWIKPGAIRLRQTGQENTAFKEISLSGYAPPGAVLP